MSYSHERYIANKENAYKSTKKWRESHVEEWREIVKINRDKQYKKNRESGQMYCSLPIKKRQEKMVEILVKKTGYDETKCKTLLIQNDWNIKSLLEDWKFYGSL